MARQLDCHARSLGTAQQGTRLPTPATSSFQSSRPLIHYHPVHHPFFYIHETHRKVYTNKPRALLMQQALYNEPQRARLLWEARMSVQALGGGSTSKTSSPSTTALGSALAQSIPPLATGSTHGRLTAAGQPLRWTVTMSVLHYSWTKA